MTEIIYSVHVWIAHRVCEPGHWRFRERVDWKRKPLSHRLSIQFHSKRCWRENIFRRLERWNTAAAKSLLDKIPENTPTELTWTMLLVDFPRRWAFWRLWGRLGSGWEGKSRKEESLKSSLSLSYQWYHQNSSSSYHNQPHHIRADFTSPKSSILRGYFDLLWTVSRFLHRGP